MPLSASGFLYVALAASIEMRDLPIVGSRYMPDVATTLYILASVVTFVISFLGFAATARESKQFFTHYKTSVLATSVLVLLACFMITMSNYSFP